MVANDEMELTAKIVAGVPSIRRGVCADAPTKQCTNDAAAPKPCGAGEGDCVGYVLQARGKR